MKIGTQDQAFFPKPILEKFQYIKALGFDTYEIDGKLLVENIEEIKDAIQQTGITVETVCNGYDGWIGDFSETKRVKAVEEIATILRAISTIGGKGIVIPAAWGMFTYRLPPMESPRSKKEDFEVVSASLLKLNKVAHETDTKIYLEPLNRYQDHMINLLEDARRYIDENSLSNVEIIADFYHMNIEEDDISLALKNHKDYIGHIHLADNHRFQPGSGSIDFKRHFKTLKEIGYEGNLVYECRLRGDDLEKVYKDSVTYIKQCMNEA